MPINGWDVQVATVRGVIGKARATVEDLRSEETALRNAVSSAAGSFNSPVILQALTECYGDHLSPLLNSGTIRGENACNSACEAVDHYVRGDVEMAGNANRLAGEAPAAGTDADSTGARR
ncbi:MAG: DUF6507 family protein [Arthrobacter sp.]